LEIGCGDGQLSSMIFDKIDEAIDINPRSVEKSRRAAGKLYRRVRCLDARQLEFSNGGFGSIFANCVIEHIPDLRGVLEGCFRGLRPGGKLVVTVPLLEMNRHLLLPWGWYAKMRQRQLAHVNLLDQEGREALFRSAGFATFTVQPYLSGSACRLWDMMDGPGCIGFGRYRLGAILGHILPGMVPQGLRGRMRDGLSQWLSAKAEAVGNKGPACAVLVIAEKPPAGALA
jgi:SAM-dependent methyltransferase